MKKKSENKTNQHKHKKINLVLWNESLESRQTMDLEEQALPMQYEHI
jgi:hypothetical protein